MRGKMRYEQMTMMSYTMAKGEWRKNPNIEVICKLTKELGLDTIDWVTTYIHTPQEIRRVCDDYGIRTVCYTFTPDINFSDKKARQPGIDKIKEGIEIAQILGTDKIMLPIGGKPGLTAEQSRRNVIEGLKDAVRIGQENQVTVTVEHFPGYLAPFVTSADMNEAIKEVPLLRITFDSGNVFTGGEDPVKGFLNSRSYIVHSHFKDWIVLDRKEGMQGRDGRYYRAELVGEGALNYEEILGVMHKAGYDGYVDFEYEGDRYTPEEAIRKGLAYLRNIMQNLP